MDVSGLPINLPNIQKMDSGAGPYGLRLPPWRELLASCRARAPMLIHVNLAALGDLSWWCMTSIVGGSE
jgi:hypothetical protein